MRILSLVLVLAACGDDPACPDPDPPRGGRVQCLMTVFLAAEGLGDDAVVDVADVDIADLASRPAWTETEPASFTLGAPGLYSTGQRIIFDADGSIRLITFAAPDQAFMQTIIRAADGALSNPGAVRLPR